MGKLLIVIGDFNAANESHLGTNAALKHCSASCGLPIDSEWIGTDAVSSSACRDRLNSASGLWLAPASPYRSMEGALEAIRMARERGIPLLGTCGGFQHIVIEYARNVLRISDAEHEESAPDASRLIISRLVCSLVGRTLTIRFKPGSRVARAYGRDSANERYHCNFGVNPDFTASLFSGDLQAVGSDDEGTVRAVELTGHPFFIGSLFLPQLNSTAAAPHPLICAFLQAVHTAANLGSPAASSTKL